MKKKTGLNGYVYHFSIDYDTVPTAATPYIHKYLMIKNSMIKNETVLNSWVCKSNIYFKNDVFWL